jgi:nucleotide-binding universal stress UspA family protein
MYSLRTILCGTDFSRESECAVEVAGALARDHGARLIVLHVLPPPVPGKVPVYLEDRDQVMEDLRALRPPDPDVVEEHLTAAGSPAERILAAAAQTRANLIVLGTHGRTGLRRMILGSVAEQVVRRAACPVLTVKVPPPAGVPAGQS